jgi:hypothetical protein
VQHQLHLPLLLQHCSHVLKIYEGFGDGMPVMTLEKWSWFLVQVQNEERPWA